MITISLVMPEECRDAYQWHRGFSSSNNALFPRAYDAFVGLVRDLHAWSARDEKGDYLGLVYSNFDSGENAWELGGLMVGVNERGRGLGSMLMRLVLGHTLFEEDPLDLGHNIFAHVHRENQEPRPIIEKSLKFRLDHSVQIPAHLLPGLRANAAGQIEGDEYHIVIPDSLAALIAWLERWDGKIKEKEGSEGREDVDVVLRSHVSLDHHWLPTFRQMHERWKKTKAGAA
jgi:Acetyltransferase (GNAT) family